MTGQTPRCRSAQVDLILPAVQLGDGTETEIGLVVVNAADPGDRAVVSLDLAGGGTLRQFHTGVSRDGVAFSDLDALSPTTSTTAAVRARWDAAQKKLFLDYDPNGPVGGYSWTTLAIYSLTLGDSSWEMGSGGRFQVGIFGASYRGTVVPASAGVQLDNFVVASDQPAPLPIRIDPVRRAGTKLHLTWTGGRGPFQVQQRATVAGGVWGNIGASTATPALDVDMPGNFGFFRILDLGQ
ncbi:MAG TPA: hypothetical protein DCM86_07520 [Verrucomicrobiales bacterium]|nr:hypothetical protein [Verrucomicrobiales bacterium]